MKIHEYQASQLLADYGVPVPRGEVAATPDEARRIAADIDGRVVVKAQIHAGGRGKGGGVKLADSPDAAADAAAGMLGKSLVTPQTTPEGIVVRQVMVAEATDIARELYLAIVVDGDVGVPVAMASTEGGVEIEVVAETNPEKIVQVAGDPIIGLTPYRARALARQLELPDNLIRPAADLIGRLYQLFVEKDCTLVEINPLVITADGRLVALDAKVNLEDDALFRHPELVDLHDPEQDDPEELRAAQAGLSYVKLEGGRVGCMVNGAGLAMATMDITRWAGAEPANFLDVGGSASEDAIAEAFRIIVSDPDVEVILVNLFGGILRTDAAAKGIVSAAKETGSDLPIVVAMRGTNSEEGLATLGESDLNITPATDLSGASEALKSILAESQRMSVLVGSGTRLLVQGLGRDGSFQASRCREYGTNMVAAVHPGRGGQKFEDAVPIFESAAEAVEETGADVGVIFVPAPFAADAIIEQVDAGIGLIVAITERIPVLDMVKVLAYMKGKDTRLIGPNCPGLIQPSTRTKIGIIPATIVREGRIGVVSRSGTLTYEAIAQLSQYGMGESTCVGIGGDPLHGTTFTDVLGMFEEDPDTDAIVLIGEIGGTREQKAAEYIRRHVTKPVVAAIVGQTAPPGKRMGHAGAIITGKAALASEKIQALSEAGAHVVDSPAYIGRRMRDLLG